MKATRNEKAEKNAGGDDLARLLAERWGLDYREQNTLSIDPRVVEIVDLEEARKLAAVPLSFGQDGPIFAVAAPSEERFAAVRAIAGSNTTFVVVAPSALEGLMNSRIFQRSAQSASEKQAEGTSSGRGGQRPKDAEPAARRSQPAEAREREPQQESPRPADAQAPESGADGATAPAEEARPADVEDTVSASAEADQRQAEPKPAEAATAAPTPAPAPQTPAAQAPAAQAPAADQPVALVEDLLAQLASSSVNLKAHVDELSAALETNQRELREAKEQLAAAHRANEDQQATIRALSDELAVNRALNDSTRAHLQDLIRSLEDAASPTAGEAAPA